MPRRRRALGEAFLGGYRVATRVYTKGFSVLASGAFAEFGPHSVIRPPVRIEGADRIAVGSGVFVDSGCWLHVEGDGQHVAIEIGDGSSIGAQTMISAVQSIRIGKRVGVGRNAHFSDHSHGFAEVDVPVGDQELTRILPVEIGDGALVGQNAVVLPGVRIGRGAVIGANSVVNIDVPDRGLAVGAPARVIRVRSADDAAMTPDDAAMLGLTASEVSPRETD